MEQPVQRRLTQHFPDQILHIIATGRLVHQEGSGPQRAPGKQGPLFRTVGQNQLFAIPVKAYLVFPGDRSAAHGVNADFSGLALGGAAVAAEYRLPEGLLTTREIRIVRRLIRDDRFRAYPPDRTLAVWDGIVRGEERWIKPFKTQADLLLNASFAYEPCLYRRIIESFADGQPAGVYRDTLNDLARKLACFEPADEALVPPDATIREFIG